MTSRELFVETIKDELPRFERVYKAVPEAGLDYRPHQKSRTARELLATLSDEAAMFVPIIEKGELDMTGYTTGRYEGVAEALGAFTGGLERAGKAASTLSDGDWDQPGRLMMDGKVEWETTRGQMAWGLLLDLVHHRGQMSVYLRPMGGTVPSIYGPSADVNA